MPRRLWLAWCDVQNLLHGGGFEGNAGECYVAKHERRVEGAGECEAKVVNVEAD